MVYRLLRRVCAWACSPNRKFAHKIQCISRIYIESSLPRSFENFNHLLQTILCFCKIFNMEWHCKHKCYLIFDLQCELFNKYLKISILWVFKNNVPSLLYKCVMMTWAMKERKQVQHAHGLFTDLIYRRKKWHFCSPVIYCHNSNTCFG